MAGSERVEHPALGQHNPNPAHGHYTTCYRKKVIARVIVEISSEAYRIWPCKIDQRVISDSTGNHSVQHIAFPDTMASIYVDEAAGSDLTGVGSQQAPYQSLAHALFTQGQSASVLVRKGPSSEYEEPTQSALKKAKKGADGLEKKRKKAEELAQAATVERENRERLLEESKKIQLVEDATLLAAVKVRPTGGCPHMRIYCRRIRRERS
jgi:hypothetical protein